MRRWNSPSLSLKTSLLIRFSMFVSQNSLCGWSEGLRSICLLSLPSLFHHPRVSLSCFLSNIIPIHRLLPTNPYTHRRHIARETETLGPPMRFQTLFVAFTAACASVCLCVFIAVLIGSRHVCVVWSRVCDAAKGNHGSIWRAVWDGAHLVMLTEPSRM